MKQTYALTRSVLAVVLTFSATFSSGLTLGNVLLEDGISGSSLQGLVLRPAASQSSVRSYARSSVRRKMRTVKRATIVRPATRRGTGTSIMRTSKGSSSAKAAIKAACGDGLLIRDLNEACDDGNVLSGDGCSATCIIETGFSCAGSPTICHSRCGDGVMVAKETCDDANNEGGDGCSATCKRELGYTCKGAPSVCEIIPYCGDAIKASTEECDDGNSTPGDGCTALCKLED